MEPCLVERPRPLRQGAIESVSSLVSQPSVKLLNMNEVRLATLRIDLEDKVTPLLEMVLDK